MKVMKFFSDSLTGLVNHVTGTGTSRDKITHATWVFQRQNDRELMALYRSSWIARKLIDIPVADMLREGWTWQADDAAMTKLEAEEERLGLKEKLRQVLTRDSIYGGGALIIGDGAEDPAQPIVPERFGLGDLKYLIVSGRGELNIKELIRRPGPDYGMPEMFEMKPLDGPMIRVHPSRVAVFNGMPVTVPLGVVAEEDFWGDSRLASVLRDIAAAMAGVAGTSRLMEELAVTYHKMAGFTERMATEEGEETVRRVIDLISQMKSSVQSVAIDAEDDVEVITASFAGLPEALRSLMQNVSGAGDIPLTRFLGSSPDGMNSTGASDIRNYYDRLAGQREAYVAPAVAYLDQFLIRSALGRDDDDIYRIWVPLWQLSETEQVDLDVKKLKMMQDLAASGVVHDHVVEEVTRTMMVDSPTFQGAETAFDEADKMPDPEPEDVEAANQLQAGGGSRPQLQVVGDDGDLEDWDLDDVKAWMSQPRHPAGSSKGGQWSGGASAKNYGPRTPEGWKPPTSGGGGGGDPDAIEAEYHTALAHYKKVATRASRLKATDEEKAIASAAGARLVQLSDQYHNAKGVSRQQVAEEAVKLRKAMPSDGKLEAALAADLGPLRASAIEGGGVTGGITQNSNYLYALRAEAGLGPKYDFKKGKETAVDAKKILGEDFDSWSAGEKSALRRYTGNSVTDINVALRDGMPPPPNMQATVKRVDAVLDRTRAQGDFMVFRGLSGAPTNIEGGSLKAGDTMFSGAFVSTSPNTTVAAQFGAGPEGYRMAIRVKAGQRVTSVKSVSEYPEHNEYLLPRNTAFVVRAVDTETRTVMVDILE